MKKDVKRTENVFEHILYRDVAHVTRFNNKPQHFGESVAEHSFFVAYYTRILCDLLKERGETVDAEKAVTMGLIHDLEEMFSGDILGPFKHYSKEVTDAIAKVNDELIGEVFAGLPEPLKNRYVALWKEEGKQACIEAQVVKLADKLTLIAKCVEEIRAGNTYFKGIYDNEMTKLEQNTKHWPWWNTIKDEILPTDKVKKGLFSSDHAKERL